MCQRRPAGTRVLQIGFIHEYLINETYKAHTIFFCLVYRWSTSESSWYSYHGVPSYSVVGSEVSQYTSLFTSSFIPVSRFAMADTKPIRKTKRDFHGNFAQMVRVINLFNYNRDILLMNTFKLLRKVQTLQYDTSTSPNLSGYTESRITLSSWLCRKCVQKKRFRKL